MGILYNPPYKTAKRLKTKTDGELSKNTQVSRMTPLPIKEVIYVAINTDLTKDERILKEVRRLNRIYANVDKDNKAIIDGLIKRAAYIIYK